MRRDFTIKSYQRVLEALVNQGFSFMRICEIDANHFMRSNANRFMLLRQDVDRLPENSLAFARIQKEFGIQSTYYFRIVPGSYEPGVIEEIAGMGHEVGYHYEDLSLAAQRLRAEGRGQKELRVSENKGLKDNNAEHGTQNTEQLFEDAIESLRRNLERLRKYADVKTICMHGSPMSRWDSRLLWKYYNYREFGVEVEPYFDFNFEEMLYLTDTGRRWNGSRVSVRDKAKRKAQSAKREKLSDLETEGLTEKAEGRRLRAEGNNLKHKTWNLDPFVDWVVKPIPGSLMNMTEKSTEFQSKYNYRTTNYIMEAVEREDLPNRIMMTFHPQRWTDETVPWVRELIWQNTKNVAKFFLIKIRQ